MKRRTGRRQNDENWRDIPLARVFTLATANILRGCGIKTQGEFFDLGSLAVLELQQLSVIEAQQALQTMRDRGHKLPHQPAGSPANTETPALPPSSVPAEPITAHDPPDPDVDQAATTYQSRPATDKLPEPAEPKRQPRLSATAAADAAALAVMQADEEAGGSQTRAEPELSQSNTVKSMASPQESAPIEPEKNEQETEKVERRKNSIMAKPITEKAISTLRLSEPIKKKCKVAGIETVEQLVDMTADELHEDVGLAEISVRTIQTKLGGYNLALKGDSVTKKDQNERRSPARDKSLVATGKTAGTPLSNSTLSPPLQKRLLEEHGITSLEDLAREFPNMENLHKKTVTAIQKALDAWGGSRPRVDRVPKAESRLAVRTEFAPSALNGHNPMASLLAGAIERLNLGNASVRRMRLVTEVDFSGEPFEISLAIKPLLATVNSEEA